MSNRVTEDELDRQADEILARHIEYAGWPESGQSMMKTRNALAAVKDALRASRRNSSGEITDAVG